MFERFTERARRVLVRAQEEARLLQHDFIGTEHIFLGLLSEGGGVAAKALADLGVTVDKAREKVVEAVDQMGKDQMDKDQMGKGTSGGRPLTARAKKVLELSLREALELGHNYIGTEHMLLGLAREGEGVGANVLRELCGDLTQVRDKVLELLGRGQTGQGAGQTGQGAGQVQRLLGLKPEAPANLPFFRGQKQGDPPYCPGCGKGLVGNLHFARIEATAGAKPASATSPGEGGPERLAAGASMQRATHWVFAYCANCGFPLGSTAAD